VVLVRRTRPECGGVLRGSDGEWLGGFEMCMEICSVYVAELWGWGRFMIC